MNELFLGDCRQVLKSLPENSIDLCITSPPYKSKDGFSEDLMFDTFTETYRLQRNNSLFFLNFGSLAEDKFRPFKVCQLAIEAGYILNDTIIWIKNHYKPIQGKRRLNNLTEFIFLLYKNKMPELDRLAIGIPYADKSNAKRFNGGIDLHCGGNVWYIDYPTINKASQKAHPDRFPLELPQRCIKLCGYPVQKVLDPFCGAGTVGIACKELKKDFIGIEKQECHFKTTQFLLDTI